ncbi:CCA tRNA nucleotidyltransferase [Oscillatoria laete-virens NRMC-F 0139]|nr:CCA tRNA nucleotidyltransferase [Oscillatoria laete-virens]MDL5052727.1 CCA tRNA nucleotidyltransferase [Oscillatoria laete-virens NRMC-F 0139]
MNLSQAKQIVQTLHDAGHTAYFAGGCVRDMLMGRAPHDYDVATSATPGQVIGLFPRTESVGAAFGVILVILDGIPTEVATFRTDGDYSDGRRPDAVHFSSPEQDARRRDFTINGLFHDPLTGQTLDYVGGRDDLAGKLLRAIGEPSRRFAEDKLRLLRCVRFATTLDFRIEPATWAALEQIARKLPLSASSAFGRS